jgi:hypothetical protein
VLCEVHLQAADVFAADLERSRGAVRLQGGTPSSSRGAP